MSPDPSEGTHAMGVATPDYSISCMYGEVFVSTISLVFLLLMAFLKLVAKIVKLYVSGLPIRLRMHAVHTSPAHTCL